MGGEQKHLRCLIVLLGLFHLCASQSVYRAFTYNNKVLTVKPTGGTGLQAVVWEPRREGDLTQRWRVSNGYIYSAYFEPAEYVLDVSGSKAGLTDVLAYPRKSPVAPNQQWKVTTTVESVLAKGLLLGVLTSGGVDKAVVNFTAARTISSDDVTVDWVFCIDTTGSMGNDIANVQSNAVNITNKLYDAGVDARIAVIDYRDYAARSHYAADYPYNVKMQFSRSQSSVISGLNALSIGFGGDAPESAYSCIMAALDGYAGYWRKDAEKYILVMTDADPLDPEPYSGYTYASVTAAANNFTMLNISTDRLYTRDTGGETIPPSVKIYAAVVRYINVMPTWTRICGATGGEATFTSNSAGVVAVIKNILDVVTAPILAARRPQLSLTVTTTNSNLYLGQQLNVNFVITNTGAADATSVLVKIAWPCINNMAVSFPGPFAFLASPPNTLLVTIEKTIFAGGGSFAFAISSDGICANSTVTEVTASATDLPTGATSGNSTLSLNTTASIDCGSLRACGDACYNPATYDCAGTSLYPTGYKSCGTGLYNTAAYDCFGNVLCPKSHLLCGAEACYHPSAYVCIDGVTLCPTSASGLCGATCFNPTADDCCNNGPSSKLCAAGTGCSC